MQFLSSLVNLQLLVEQLLNCISSAAATVGKSTPAKSKACYAPPALQPNAFLEHTKIARRRHPNKKRKMQALDGSSKLNNIHVNIASYTYVTQAFSLVAE